MFTSSSNSVRVWAKISPSPEEEGKNSALSGIWVMIHGEGKKPLVT